MKHRLGQNRPAGLPRPSTSALGRGAVVVVAVGLGLSACSGTEPTGSVPAPAPTSASAGAPTAESPGPAPVEASGGPESSSPTGTPAPPLPNPVTTPIAKTVREGGPAQPSITPGAPSHAFSDAAVYRDGVEVKIGKARGAVEEGHGPGVFAGREYVAFDVEIDNKANAPLDLSQVVVTAHYGPSKQLAPPVYTASAETADFGTGLKPGEKASATYGFAIPKSDLGEVTLVVDFDGVHASAVYSGSVELS